VGTGPFAPLPAWQASVTASIVSTIATIRTEALAITSSQLIDCILSIRLTNPKEVSDVLNTHFGRADG